MANIAPVLDNSSDLTLGTLQASIDDANNVGIAIADLIDGLITDADGDVGAIAITQASSPLGTWQYSLNGGDTWVNLTNISEATAIVLGAIPLYAPGANGGTPEPDEQSWFSLTRVLPTFPFLTSQGEATATEDGTTLDTTTTAGDNPLYAGYSNYEISANILTQQFSYSLKNNLFPDLDPVEGFRLSFEVQILSNTFTNNDRAVFSIVLVMADGASALELGFQRTGVGQGRIFAQSDDVTPNPGNEPNTLFAAAEEVTFDTTQLARYTLDISGSTYSLEANGSEILTGPLRDYSNFAPPSQGGITPPNPYNVPNLLFLGDNSTSAGGSFTLGDVTLQTETRLRFDPNPGADGQATLDFRAWDGSNGSIPGTSVDATTNGGTTAFSTATESVAVTVDSPVSSHSFGAATYSIAEGNARRTVSAVVVERTGTTSATSSVLVSLSPGSTNPATLGQDYATSTVQVDFAVGETQKAVDIRVLGDRAFEPNEQITLTLSSLNGSEIGAQATTTLTLRNDDPLNITGTRQSEVLRGDNGRNRLRALGGNDLLLGLNGNDTLLGGAGRDILNGGAGFDLKIGGPGADVFRYQSGNFVSAHRNSLVSAPDWIADFNARLGDRIQLDYDNNLGTRDRPRRVFNAGRVQGANFTAAVLNAFTDKNQSAAGRQRLQRFEAVFFQYGAQTYLAVNDNQVGFSGSRDMIVRMTNLQYFGNDANRGVLNTARYFI